MNSTEKLYDYLNLKLINSVNFNDLKNLCFSLFCTTDILPENLKFLKITKKVLALTFMRIVTETNLKPNSIDYTENENYWIDHIDKSIRLNRQPNFNEARILLGTN